MKYFQITFVMVLFFGFVLISNFATKDNLIALFSEEEEHQVDATTLILSGETNSAGASPIPTSASSTNSTVADTTSNQSNSNSNGLYKDGEYTGTSENAYYGYVKVKAVISGGRLTDVVFLDHPTHNRTSDYINSQAMPLLTAAAISAQSANVGRVSGASDTSIAFRQSLASALAQAK